ncbi:MAG: Jag N-terminal domain-containing protein [Helicobacteraceae bacterium]|nr:Jag N-terminal domain-containing protein [Helicobacteraceae bacterium]
MKKIEAPTLQEAYTLAALEFGCSVTDLDFEVGRQPSPGIFGLFRKTAIVYAAKKERSVGAPAIAERKTAEFIEPVFEPSVQEPKASKPPEPVKREAKIERYEKPAPKLSASDSLIDEAFSDRAPLRAKETKKERPKTSVFSRPKFLSDRGENFGSLESSLDRIRQKSQDHQIACKEIQTALVDLFSHTSYKIGTIDVSVLENNVLRVFFDGEDAALLIGKDGYRYKALSYILFNWINPTYGYLLRLEIAEFLQNQEEMIGRYLEPVIAQIAEHGKGQTRTLDGVLVQIALKELRARFPDKYVGIKTSQDGEGKYVVVSDFIRRYER